MNNTAWSVGTTVKILIAYQVIEVIHYCLDKNQLAIQISRCKILHKTKVLTHKHKINIHITKKIKQTDIPSKTGWDQAEPEICTVSLIHSMIHLHYMS